MFSALHALILGIVEGFTEFLPISSTAHLILAESLLRISQSDFTKTFDIVIQSGAILAVVALYWRKFFNWEVLKRLVVAFIPTGVIGLALYSVVKTYLLGSVPVVLWALALGGVLLIGFEYLYAKREREGKVEISAVAELSYKKAALIGACQAVAIIPGVSRSAATIVGGMLLGVSRETIVEFSFLLAVPTMLAATGLDVVKNLSLFSSGNLLVLAIGFVAAFLSALFGIRFLLRYIRTHTFTAFSIYRIALVALFLLLAVIGAVTI
jgi:undecaprenyl-diphosphatase